MVKQWLNVAVNLFQNNCLIVIDIPIVGFVEEVLVTDIYLKNLTMKSLTLSLCKEWNRQKKRKSKSSYS